MQKHGLDGFKRLRRRPIGARLQEFAAAYPRRALGEDLVAALREMEQQSIAGQFPWYCDGEEIPWPNPGDLEVMLRGLAETASSGARGWWKGPRAGGRIFVLDVPAAGIYTLTVSTVMGATAGTFAVLDGCEGTKSGNILTSDGVSGTNRLGPGRHRLRLGLRRTPASRR